jgi:hypothetical protein
MSEHENASVSVAQQCAEVMRAECAAYVADTALRVVTASIASQGEPALARFYVEVAAFLADLSDKVATIPLPPCPEDAAEAEQTEGERQRAQLSVALAGVQVVENPLVPPGMILIRPEHAEVFRKVFREEMAHEL